MPDTNKADKAFSNAKLFADLESNFEASLVLALMIAYNIPTTQVRYDVSKKMLVFPTKGKASEAIRAFAARQASGPIYLIGAQGLAQRRNFRLGFGRCSK